MNQVVPSQHFELQTKEYTYKKINGYIYEFQAILGKGNFSTVYKGIQETTNQQVAIKVVELSSLTCKKLEELLDQEISIIQGLNHQNIIRCNEVLKSKNNCYIITELCNGGNLQKTIEMKGRFNEGQIWPYVLDIYQGLKYLAHQNIIHRDIKPANIFIKDKTLKIADFGFAIQFQCLFHDCNIGSPIYMTPQGYLHSVYGPKTDIWALGVIIFELLHGYQPLYRCTSAEDLKANIGIGIKDSQFHPSISPQVKNLIKRCLQVDQTKRISMQELENSHFLQRFVIMRSLNSQQSNPQCMRRNSAIQISQKRCMNFKQQTLNLPRISIKQFKRASERNNKENNQQVFQENKAIKENKENKADKADKADKVKKADGQKLAGDEKQAKHFLTINRKKTMQNASFYVKYSNLLGQISYNQSIGFIHYCRIGFKIVPFLQDKTLISLIKSTIIKILQEIKEKLINKELKFAKDQHRQKKEQKLKNVVEEYLYKYEKLMIGEKIKVKVKDLSEKLWQTLKQCENTLRESKVYDTYLKMIFSLYTKMLLDCSESGDYDHFGQSGYIETCLTEYTQYYTIGDYYQQKSRLYQHYKIQQ